MRKRRSSILKSQRAPRAPLSELEFNVATPTDTTKSRRVSFSRRTGVAEFITNEATTTWKNFYEEHNKSLESSGNDSGMNPPRPSVGHLGKRIFDLEFPEVEAIDFAVTLNDGRSAETSMDPQYLEYTLDNNPAAPQGKFELSTFTDNQSKVFSDDLAISGLKESTDKISVNFSSMQPLEYDDLDEIQKNIDEQAKAHKFVCPGPVTRRSGSGYIEVDLNITNMAMKGYDESDMSITDTIHSPKVNVSKGNVTGQSDKPVTQDWVAEKENILLNPYVAPKESANFAINEESDKVLVFDGKRLTLQSDKEPLTDYRKTLLPDTQPEATPQRKTIILNVDDDLPNLEDIQASMSHHSKVNDFEKTTLDNNDISMTQPLVTRVETNKRQTIVFEGDAEVSMTEAVINNVLMEKSETPNIIDVPQEENKTKDTLEVDSVPSDETVVGNIYNEMSTSQMRKENTLLTEKKSSKSFTKAVSSHIISPEKGVSGKCCVTIMSNLLDMPDVPVLKKESNDRKTILFVEDAGNISITQSLPTNVMYHEKSTLSLPGSTKILVNEFDMSLPYGQQSKRRTIMFDTDAAEVSITEALPSNVILADKLKVDSDEENLEEQEEVIDDLEIDDDDEDVIQETDYKLLSSQSNLLGTKSNSGTSLEPTVTCSDAGRRKTVVFDNDAGDLSMTRSLPTHVIHSASNEVTEQCEKRRTIVFEPDDADISMTRALPTNVLLSTANKDEGKRKTIVFDEQADISMTRALPTNVILSTANEATEKSEKRKTIVFESDDADISMTRALPTNVLLSASNKDVGKRKTIVFDEDAADISMTRALLTNVILSATNEATEKSEKRKTIVFDPDDADISMTQAIPTNIVTNAASVKRKTIIYDNNADVSVTQALPTNVIQSAFDAAPEKRKTIVFEPDDADISMTQAIPTNIVTNAVSDTRKIFENEADISMTRSLPTNVITESTTKSALENAERTKTSDTAPVNADISVVQNIVSKILTNATSVKRNTIISESNPDISMTEAQPPNILICGTGSLSDYCRNDEFSSVTSSTTTVTQSVNNRDADEADVSLTESEEVHKGEVLIHTHKISLAIDQLCANKIATLKTRVSVNPIPEEMIKLQKEMAKSPFKKFTLEPSRLQDDVMVYQTSTGRSELGDQAPAVSSNASVTGTDTEMRETFHNALSEMTTSSSNSAVVAASHFASSLVDAVTSDRLFSPVKKEQATVPEVPYDVVSKTTSVMSQGQSALEKSILDQLLDMDDGDDGVDDKGVSAQLSIQSHSQSDSAPEIRRESMFYITRDSTDDTQTEKSNDEIDLLKNLTKTSLSIYEDDADDDEQRNKLSVIRNLAKQNVKAIEDQRLPLRLEFENVLEDIGKKFNEYEKQAVPKSFANRHFEKVVSVSGMSEHKHKNCNDVNSSKDIFDILSRFTEQEEIANPLEPVLSIETCQKDEQKEKFSVSPQVKSRAGSRVALRLGSRVESRIEPHVEPLVVSRGQSRADSWLDSRGEAPRRQSVVLNKEDLLANLSRAQIELQEFDAEESVESPGTRTSSGTKSPKKVRMSLDVAKTLHFEDESTDVANKFESGLTTPLKKTAFGESSYMREELVNNNQKHKPYVIPPYLSDVTDGVKELMNDLVKPMADVLPFDSTGEGRVKKSTSTCSTQIQANLFQSSQIDLTTSNPGSSSSLVHSPKKLKSIMKSYNSSSDETIYTEHPFRATRSASKEPPSARVIPFDPNNPLNNVLLVPIDITDAHRYDPTDVSSCPSYERPDRTKQIQFKEVGERYTANYNVPIVIPKYPILDDVPSKDVFSIVPEVMRLDTSVETQSYTKEEQVNTVIAMKDNFALLKESSSLTLVDDTSMEVDNVSDVDTGTSKNQTREPSNTSLASSFVEIIYDVPNTKQESVTSDDEEKQTDNRKKRKQPDRHKNCTISSLDVTLKPASKMAKRAIHEQYVTFVKNEKEVDTSDSNINDTTKHKNKQRKSVTHRKPGTTITVQRVTTDYDNKVTADQICKGNELTTYKETSSTASSTTSSKPSNPKAEGDGQSMSSVCVNETSPSEWLPELLQQLSSRSTVPDDDSFVDMVTKINSLPFIVNGECQWERVSNSRWSFLLLLGRIQLTFLLPEPAAAWHRVLCSTPVLNVALDVHMHNMKNSIAILCVHFAAEAMRYVLGAGCARADDAPALLRRCAGIARLALRWGRAMHSAWTQLAYTLTSDGFLTLKVANIPLRSVWEVSMRISLVVEDAREIPWPRVTDVQAVTLLGNAPRVGNSELSKITGKLRRDWGHTPRALWKVFRYLKNKTRDDEFILGKSLPRLTT